MAMQQEVVSLAGTNPAPDPADLRVAIARTGVRQFVIAQKIGISEGQLSRLLTGRKPLTEEIAERIRLAIAEAAAA
jgi:transcriptional regulator with XRE-family HTH domain